MTFRWFGDADPIPLKFIRQIPCIGGIVSALYDVPAGGVWPHESVARLAETISASGLELKVIESIPVHEDIKLGRRDCVRLIDNYCESLRSVADARVSVVCYNFMPVFDWIRTDLEFPLPDGSTALAYDDVALKTLDLSSGTLTLPGWGARYSAAQLAELSAAYTKVDANALWENLHRFLERVVPVAESVGVKLAIHPDDPPWPVLGLPRIIVDAEALRRVCDLVDSPANGLTFCTGSLGANPEIDLPVLARELAQRGRIHFVHCRNVRVTGPRRFHEISHTGQTGSVDLRAVLGALHASGFSGPIRPDHGRMIWGETGRPGYGLHDRALGAMYLSGLWESLSQ